MSDYSDLPGDDQSPPLRIVYGDDDITNTICGVETDGDDDPTPAEMNGIVLGFRPAIRISTRLSA